MSLLRWSVVMVLGFAGGVSPTTLASPTQPPQPAAGGLERMATQVEPKTDPKLQPKVELEARVEIGPAVVFIYDDAGRVIATE